MKSLGEYEIWFLTGSQDLYGEDTLRQVADHAALVAAGLDDAASVPVRIVFKPVVKSPEGIKAACVAASADEDCVGVIAWMHTFSPAKMWIAGLQALRKPLLHLHTQFNRDLPWGEIDMDFMNLNQAAHGDREFAHIETRLGIARKTVSGHWQDPEVAARVGAWARAACGRHDAQGLKVARFGDNMRHVAVTEGDKAGVQIQLGVSVNGFSVGDLAAAVRAVPDAAVDALVDDYEASYTLAPTLRAGGADREALLEAARIEAALRAFMAEGGFGALTDTFENLDGLRQLPGIAAQRLMADGYGFGAEGDWKTAIMVRLCKTMARGLPGGTSFMEDYTYHLDPGGPARPGLAHARDLPDDRRGPALLRDPPALDRRPERPGAPRLRRRARPGHGDGAHGHGRPAAAARQRGGGRAPARADAALARRPRGLAASPGLRHRDRGLAHGRRVAPHGAVASGGHRGDRRLRRDDGHRAAGHRRRHHDPRVQPGAAMERGVPPHDRGPLTMGTLMLPELREQVWRANQAIVAAGLVTLSFGNASGVDRDAGVLLIKPSGVPYDVLRPEDLVAVSLADGAVVEGDLRPSSDTPTHLLLYQRFASIGGVVHTHSTAAVGWAQAGRKHPGSRDDPRRPLPRPGAAGPAAHAGRGGGRVRARDRGGHRRHARGPRPRAARDAGGPRREPRAVHLGRRRWRRPPRTPSPSRPWRRWPPPRSR